MLQQETDADRVFSLGDSEMPDHELNDLNIVSVKGNFPFEPRVPYELLFNFEGVNVFLTHGHRYHVKSGLTRLMYRSEELETNITCFGHTHLAYLRDYNGIIYLNPGSLSKPRSGIGASYATVEIDDQKIDIKIIDLETKESIKHLIKKR